MNSLFSLLTWKHYEGCKKLFIMLCCGFVISALLPASYMWKFMGKYKQISLKGKGQKLVSGYSLLDSAVIQCSSLHNCTHKLCSKDSVILQVRKHGGSISDIRSGLMFCNVLSFPPIFCIGILNFVVSICHIF